MPLFMFYSKSLCNRHSNPKLAILRDFSLGKKCPYSVLFWSAFFPHFPAFGLNTERYSVSLRMRENAENMQTRITPKIVFYKFTKQLIGIHFVFEGS